MAKRQKQPPSVVVVGSSNTDLVVQSDKLPEPGMTVLGGKYQVIPGGKGANQAVAAARAGHGLLLLRTLAGTILATPLWPGWAGRGSTLNSSRETGVHPAVWR